MDELLVQELHRVTNASEGGNRVKRKKCVHSMPLVSTFCEKYKLLDCKTGILSIWTAGKTMASVEKEVYYGVLIFGMPKLFRKSRVHVDSLAIRSEGSSTRWFVCHSPAFTLHLDSPSTGYATWSWISTKCYSISIIVGATKKFSSPASPPAKKRVKLCWILLSI